MTTRIFCDKCGKQLSRKEGYFSVSIQREDEHDAKSGEGAASRDFTAHSIAIGADLCSVCAAKTAEFLRSRWHGLPVRPDG